MENEENKFNREEMMQDIKENMSENYKEYFEDASFSERVALDLPYMLIRHKSKRAVVNDYRDTAEAEIIGQMVSDMIDNGKARETFAVLTKGSLLGEQLEEIYRSWDETVNRTSLMEYFESTLDYVNSELLSEDEFIDPDAFKEADEQLEQDNNEEVIKKLLHEMKENDPSMMKTFRKVLDSLEDEQRESDGNIPKDIDDFPFH